MEIRICTLVRKCTERGAKCRGRDLFPPVAYQFLSHPQFLFIFNIIGKETYFHLHIYVSYKQSSFAVCIKKKGQKLQPLIHEATLVYVRPRLHVPPVLICVVQEPTLNPLLPPLFSPPNRYSSFIIRETQAGWRKEEGRLTERKESRERLRRGGLDEEEEQKEEEKQRER